MPYHPLTSAMIRNVPHISSQTSKISLQSCLTFNSVFQQPQQGAVVNPAVASHRYNSTNSHNPRSYNKNGNNNNNNNGNNNGNNGNRNKNGNRQKRRNYSTTTNNTTAANSLHEFQQFTKNVPKQSLPYYKQLLAFDECLAHNSFFDPKTGDVPGGTAQFWDSIEKIMPLYNELLFTSELNKKRMDELVSLLRNGLRMHRFELSKLKKNLDRDLNSPLQQIQYYLKNSIIKISNDLVNNSGSNLKISSRGLTNLFKAYTDMGLSDEAALIWNKGKKNPKLYDLFTSESVLGSILTLLIENKEFNFNEISSIYQTIKNSKNENDIIHSELQVAMIRACLLKNQNNQALEIFKEITTDVLNYYKNKNLQPPLAVKNYMTMAHLSFIGYCQDFQTANIFFEDSFNNELPYLTPIQINYVKKFMNNTWNNTKDFNKVTEIWISTWKYFENSRKSTTAISSSLNDGYLEIFFNKFDEFNNDAAIELKKLLEEYSKIKKMDEPFFNCLITKSIKWSNKDVFQSIVKVADLYNFPKTNVYHRCVLKASGSVKLLNDDILKLFKRLINSNLQLGSNYLTNADWFAFRDATIHSKFLTDEKIDIYFKVLKLSCKHFLNLQNFNLYKNLDIGLDSRYSGIYYELGRISTDDIENEINELHWFNTNNSISNHLQNQGIEI